MPDDDDDDADRSAPSAFPSLANPSLYPSGDHTWVSHLEHAYDTNTLSSLVPKNPRLNVTKALWDPRERIAGRQVNEGVISTFWGHTRAIKEIIKNGDESALILEDDVDVEWDLERLWSRIERRLPKATGLDEGWDATFLGHCWGRELLSE